MVIYAELLPGVTNGLDGHEWEYVVCSLQSMRPIL